MKKSLPPALPKKNQKNMYKMLFSNLFLRRLMCLKCNKKQRNHFLLCSGHTDNLSTNFAKSAQKSSHFFKNCVPRPSKNTFKKQMPNKNRTNTKKVQKIVFLGGSRGVQRTRVCFLFVALGAPGDQNGPKTSPQSLGDPQDYDFSLF